MWGQTEWSDESSCSSVECEAEELTTLHYQSGRIEIGGKDEDGEESMRFRVDFNCPFNSTPTIFLCPEGEIGADYADVFGVTVIRDTVDTEGFECNIGRMAKKENFGWGQNLQLNWLAVDSNSSLLQTTIVMAGPKEDEDAESISVEARFPRPFPRGTKPAVFCTAYGGDHPDTFACSIQHTGTKRCHINICRGIGGGWGQHVEVAVLATTIFPCTTLELGDNGDERDCAYRDLDFPIEGGFRRRPLILTMPVHQSGSGYPDAFVASPANVTESSFQLNVQRGNPDENGWGQNLRCTSILIP